MDEFEHDFQNIRKDVRELKDRLKERAEIIENMSDI